MSPEERLDTLCTAMSVVHVNQFNLILFIDKIHFSRWNYAVWPHFVDTVLQVFTTVNSHEYNIIFRRFTELPSKVFPLPDTQLLPQSQRLLWFLYKRVL